MKKILAMFTLAFAMLLPAFAVVPYTSEPGKFTVSFIVAPTVEINTDATKEGIKFTETIVSAGTDTVQEFVNYSDYPFAITDKNLEEAANAALSAINVQISKLRIGDRKGYMYHTAVGTVDVKGIKYVIFYANTGVGNRMYQVITLRPDGPPNADVDAFLDTFDITP